MTENVVELATNEQRADFAAYRSSMYRTASAAFTVEPGRDQLEALVGAACAAQDDDCVLDCERRLFEHLRSYEGSDFGELRTSVASEYAALFVGPRRPLAPLYESVYHGDVKRLNTDVTMAVRGFYERNGFTVVKRNSVPNDHMGLELEFMARLCEREEQAFLAGDESGADALRTLQRAFLVEHLSVWAGPFAERVSQAPVADYYKAWSSFVASFVESDRAFLEREAEEGDRAQR